ncbi:MAG TPA: hypothetical protein VFC92_10785 [Bacteroidales bacterium]|nr:hypothetical protein [Bacteroidales bacterium]
MKNISKFLILMIFGSVLFTGCQGSTNSENAEANAAMKDSQNEDGSMAHFDKVIGELRDGQIVMVADADELRARWQRVVNEQVKPGISFTRIWIVNEADNYFLRGSDSINYASSIIRLALDGDKIYELKLNNVGKEDQVGSETIMCSGCESSGPGAVGECEVHYGLEGGYYCSDCSAGNCQKTHILSVGRGIL